MHKFYVTNVQIYGGYVLYSGTIVEESMDIGSKVKCAIEEYCQKVVQRWTCDF